MGVLLAAAQQHSNIYVVVTVAEALIGGVVGAVVGKRVGKLPSNKIKNKSSAVLLAFFGTILAIYLLFRWINQELYLPY